MKAMTFYATTAIVALTMLGAAQLARATLYVVFDTTACAFDAKVLTSDQGAQPLPELALTVTNNSYRDQKAVMQISADIGVDSDAEVRISYAVSRSIDSPQDPVEGRFGPANLANYTQYFEGRMLMAVIPVPPQGIYTITPFWRVSGEPGKTATMVGRCATVDLRSQP